jgi:hypothetical protein
MIRLRDLTMGERLWLWARRRNLSRKAIQARYSVGPKMVTDWMRDRRDDVPLVRLDAELTKGERCAVYRRRSGKDILTVASEMGVSHLAIINWESDKGMVDRLLEFWGDDSSMDSSSRDDVDDDEGDFIRHKVDFHLGQGDT